MYKLVSFLLTFQVLCNTWGIPLVSCTFLDEYNLTLFQKKSLGFREGLGFRGSGSGFGFRVPGSRFGVRGFGVSGFGGSGFGFRVSGRGFGFRGRGFGVGVSGLRFGVWGLGRVSGFGFRV